jgi:3-oxoacyl-[acyl-carrier protein] reductase
MTSLTGKVAVVTGGSGGIGRSTALEFAKQGANVVIQYNKGRDEAEEVAQEISNLDRRTLLARVDFNDFKASPQMVQEMVDLTLKQFGRADILVNLAGYPAKGEWNKSLLDLTPGDFLKPVYVDLFGSFLCSRALAPHFLERKSGVIVNVSSTPALSGHDRGFAFTVAKAGVIGLTKALAVELAPYVRVNTVALGNIETAWVKELNREDLIKGREENLIKRFGTPEEIAKIIVFLGSDDSGFINGQTLVLDGGNVLH